MFQYNPVITTRNWSRNFNFIVISTARSDEGITSPVFSAKQVFKLNQM